MTTPPPGSANGDGSMSLALARGFLHRQVEVVIDRPLGSRHPTHGFVYTVNYGFVSGTWAPDGDELDAYYLGELVPLTTARGICVAIVHRRDDDDDKLVVVPIDKTHMDDDAIAAAVEFQERPGCYRLIRAAES